MKADHLTGSIEVGKAADLVLIDGNPLEDMAEIRKTTLVIKGDRLYKSDELYESIGVMPFIESINIK